MSDAAASDDPAHDWTGDGTLGPLAWTALVARWVEVARASRAIPPALAQLRDSIPHLIAIESTTAALGELGRVPEIDRPHARAVAEVTIRRAAAELDRLWRGEEWPDEIFAACEAAERALASAAYAGLSAIFVSASNAIVVPEFNLGYDPNDASTHTGTLAAMPPGSIAMPGEPICWWSGRSAPDVAQLGSDNFRVERNVAPCQVYRGLDERGRFTDDVVAPITGELLPGLPMLVPLLLDGVRIGCFLRPAADWHAMQHAAMDGRALIPVHHRPALPLPSATDVRRVDP
jgi:hypothetical protein